MSKKLHSSAKHIHPLPSDQSPFPEKIKALQTIIPRFAPRIEKKNARRDLREEMSRAARSDESEER